MTVDEKCWSAAGTFESADRLATLTLRIEWMCHLHQDPPHQHVLPCRVKLDAAVGHDELVGRNVGRRKRDANLLRLRGAGPVDRIEQGHNCGEIASWNVRKITSVRMLL